ncbi:hypothetical protein MLOOGBEN_21785 [Bacillus sp. EB106-08-02-XG196]|uniref:hypothetical protein n=1 Tax=Bacillus sp. EB106-08-02-XG196 TaxID=2737049 RepID=UPI001820C512|nr:hypothetical protein [Bacillus sp. EB106-08-02-XG196]NWQ43336.1 hypothetical protein [Bacillus sp. EB106-08-02-XG196]
MDKKKKKKKEKEKEKQQEVFQPIIDRNQKGIIRRRTQRNLLLLKKLLSFGDHWIRLY